MGLITACRGTSTVIHLIVFFFHFCFLLKQSGFPKTMSDVHVCSHKQNQKKTEMLWFLQLQSCHCMTLKGSKHRLLFCTRSLIWQLWERPLPWLNHYWNEPFQSQTCPIHCTFLLFHCNILLACESKRKFIIILNIIKEIILQIFTVSCSCSSKVLSHEALSYLPS